MRQLIPASRWIKEIFPEGGVSTNKVAKWIRERIIPGLIIDGYAYVDAYPAALLIEGSVELLPPATLDDASSAEPAGNANIARIVQAGLQS